MGEYEVEKVKRHGDSFMDVGINPALTNVYLDDALGAMQDLRTIFPPGRSVIDQLQAHIDEVWPAGASIMNLMHEGKLRKLKRGTCREFPEGQSIDPHHDNFSFDASAFPGAPPVSLQLSCNGILGIANGGELVLYPRRIRTREEELALRDPMSLYGLRAELLGTPYVVQPREGDLIIFCANRGHTVMPSFGGSRFTTSMFAGFVGWDQSLDLFN
jgi:hypothetical protein